MGPLLTKIFILDKEKKLDESIIRTILDLNFRNALAHGWHRVEDHQLVYFEESLGSEPKVMDEVEMLGSEIHLKIFATALPHLVTERQLD